MRTIYFHKHQAKLRDDAPRPTPATGEVLLRPLLRGICGTDKALLNGYAEFSGIPGHEFVAEVCEFGTGVEPTWLGQRVVSKINIGCGQCEHCQQNVEEHCANRRVIGIRQHDGAFADYLLAPACNLVAVPNTISDQQAVFAEPLAAALRVETQLASQDYTRILIVGAGTLGQLIARVMVSAGKQVSIVCRHPSQRQSLAELDVQCLDHQANVSNSADVVIEASGSESGLSLALDAIKPRGSIVIKSSYRNPIDLDLASLMVNEVSLIGSRCGSISSALDALCRQRVDTQALIDSIYTLENFDMAFTRAQQAGALKVLLS